MTHDEEKAALDKAFSDALGKLFVVLENNIRQRTPLADEKYADGRAILIRAYKIALDHSLKHPVK